MKKLFVLLAFGMGTASLANAQQKPEKVITIKTPTVQCEECQHRIERYLAKEEGLDKYVVNYRNKTVKVWYFTDRTDPETIKTAIANAGYDADDVTANADSYKKLPLCCKKTEDGGGHKKP
jgi:periplasmic mercuric ion binding protein